MGLNRKRHKQKIINDGKGNTQRNLINGKWKKVKYSCCFSVIRVLKKIKMARDTTFKGGKIVNSPVKGDGVIIQLTSLLAVIKKKK